MKHVLLSALTLLFLTAGLDTVAQETKTKEKSAAGAKTKTKAEADKTKVKTETADGKETKIVAEDDKVVIKGEGVGQQVDTSMARSLMGNLNLDAVRQEINANNQLWGQAVAKGDSAGMISLYHAEALIYPPNQGMMTSRVDMGRMAAAMPSMGIQRVELSTTEVIGGPELVVETGTFQMHDANKVVDRGKYMVVWKQENGRWRIYRDMWNSDMAPGPR